MTKYWMKYTLSLPGELEEIFSYTIIETEYTLGWIEPQVEVITTNNGYDYAELTEKPMTAYLFEPLSTTEQEQTARLQRYLDQWEGRIKITATEQVEEENESWKDEFTSVQVEDWLIAPSWEDAQVLEQAEHVLYIDPGAAFGTGYHGTTQDILRFLQESELAGKTILDVGAGSGILSIFSLLNGAAYPVYAADINPETDYQLKQNLALNQLSDQSVKVLIGDASVDDHLLSLEKYFDFIFINIGGEEVIQMLPLVKRTFKPTGRLLLSGIVEWILPKVVEAYEQAGFYVMEQKQSEEWVTLLLELCDNKGK
ncbi:50S ribosomal protein L11 methyltransferase [Brevibacillus laterosporus]|uniref:50S ribosomal protein L11 methyltransferase n=1 Tax=Brevibacillus laterosporus TaxID=1465 RepID=UPI000839D413|nr:50S ribosomal protein L11 methyltransferase [Brevibacillus laterosporus]